MSDQIELAASPVGPDPGRTPLPEPAAPRRGAKDANQPGRAGRGRPDRPLTATQLGLRVGPPAVAIGVLALVWQYYSRTNASILPPLPDIWSTFTDGPGAFFSDARYTLTSALLGFLVGGVVSLLLAALMVHLRVVERAVIPIAVLINVTPTVAIAPLLISGLGFGRSPHVIVVALIVSFPILINALTGLGSVDPKALEVFRSVAASRTEIFWRLRLPSSLPYLFAGAKVALPLAMIGSVVSEFTGTAEGLGASIIRATTVNSATTIWVDVFLLAALAVILLLIATVVERVALRWDDSRT